MCVCVCVHSSLLYAVCIGGQFTIPIVLVISLLHVGVMTAYYRLFKPDYRDVVKVRRSLTASLFRRSFQKKITCIRTLKHAYVHWHPHTQKKKSSLAYAHRIMHSYTGIHTKTKSCVHVFQCRNLRFWFQTRRRPLTACTDLQCGNRLRC